MATVTEPIMTDATGQSIDSKLNSLLGKMDNLAAAFQPNASGIVYSNATSGLTGDDVQEAIDEMAADVSEIKQSLSVLDVTDKFTFANGVNVNTNRTFVYKIGNLVLYHIVLFGSYSTNTVLATIDSSIATKDNKQVYDIAFLTAGGSNYARCQFEGTTLKMSTACSGDSTIHGYYVI